MFLYFLLSPYEATYNGLWFVEMALAFSSLVAFVISGGWVLGKIMYAVIYD